MTFASLAWGCEAEESGTGNTRGPVTAPIASLPTWNATVALTIGGAAGAGDDFASPSALGADNAGDIYVIDSRLWDVRRFDATGKFLGYVVRPGEGPGEMRLPPETFGLIADSLWYSEAPTGRIHFVSLDATRTTFHDTGWNLQRLGELGIMRVYPTETGEYWLEAQSIDRTVEAVRPSYKFRYLRANSDTAQIVHEYDAAGLSTVFDGGRTTGRYPGPPDHPILFRIGNGRLLRIDRPYPENAVEASVRFEVMNADGDVIRREEIRVPSVQLRPTTRDSIESAMIATATWDGARLLAAPVRRQIQEFVAAIPDRLPAFEQAERGPNGSIWLKLGVQDAQGRQKWLVLDSLFTPMAQALVPEGVTAMTFQADESWWATLSTPAGEPVVARLRFEH